MYYSIRYQFPDINKLSSTKREYLIISINNIVRRRSQSPLALAHLLDQYNSVHCDSVLNYLARSSPLITIIILCFCLALCFC